MTHPKSIGRWRTGPTRCDARYEEADMTINLKIPDIRG